MKTLFLLPCLLLLTPFSLSAETFPGLRSIMSEADWHRSGLDQLAPEQITVLDASLARYVTRLESRLTAQAVEIAAANAPTARVGATDERSVWQRFGLPSLSDDWRSLPALEAKVVRWRGGNRFVLDNGQVWEGLQSIPYELVGRSIRIEPRPRGQYALVVEGQSSPLRVLRVE